MADLRWNPVSVNFNDASALMRNAGDSISKAGTVFGELRKSILDEEQRAIENAYKEKQMAESIRQFNERLGFEQSKWGDEKILKELEQKETHRHNEASERNQAASVDIQRMTQQFQESKWQEEQRQLREQAAVFGNYFNNRNTDTQNMAAYSAKRREEIGEYDTGAALAQNEIAMYDAQLQQNPDSETAAIIQEKRNDALKRLDHNNMVRQVWAENNPEPTLLNKDANTLEAMLRLTGELGKKGVYVSDITKTPLGPLIVSSIASEAEAAKADRTAKAELAKVQAQEAAKRGTEMAKLAANAKPLGQQLEERNVSPAFTKDVQDIYAVIKQYAAKHGLPTPTAKQAIDWWMSAYGVDRNLMDIGTLWMTKTPEWRLSGRRATGVTLKDLESPLTAPLSDIKKYLDATRRK